MTLTDRLNTLFTALDHAADAPETILVGPASRERYESILMFAYRKLQAARYHSENVDRLVSIEEGDLARAIKEHRTTLNEVGSRNGAASVRTDRSAQPFAFELSAFLVAIKTGLDFLATVGALHLHGVDADSVKTLIKLVDKGKDGPILDEVAAAMPWLTALRDYRHHLVHRLVLQPTAGWLIEARGGSIASTLMPVVLPEHTPAYVPDTRRVRMMEAQNAAGTMETRSLTTVTHADGRTETLSHELAIEPAAGQVTIQAFMAHHFAHFESYFLAVVERLIVLKFRLANPT